jgi:RNA polymerase sigma-54 factor
MAEVARWLGIHASTVSRAVAGKHAQTPFGVFPLRWFFQAGSASDGDVARDRVRELVWTIVSGEDKSAPLSDDAIMAELAARGHAVARRTVAQYRAELDLPSSYRRRRFG